MDASAWFNRGGSSDRIRQLCDADALERKIRPNITHMSSTWPVNSSASMRVPSIFQNALLRTDSSPARLRCRLSSFSTVLRDRVYVFEALRTMPG